MQTPLLELEGTWREIADQLPDFGERRLRLVVFPILEQKDTGSPPQIQDPRLKVLDEIKALLQTIDPKPDPNDFLREGRSGGMFGYEPTE